MLKKVFVTGMSIKGEPISQISDALIHPFHDHLYNTILSGLYFIDITDRGSYTYLHRKEESVIFAGEML